MSARRTAIALVCLVAVLVGYLVWRAVLLVSTGRPAGIALGVGVVLLAGVGSWLVLLEVRFGRDSERLGKVLAAEGGLPADVLPLAPSGRIDRAAADAVFARRRDEVEQAPEDWRGWYRLAVAYGDSGDTRRGRQAMRRALALAGRQPGARD